MIRDGQQMVRDFHRAIRSTIGDTPAIRDAELRAKLILEEAIELAVALVGTELAEELLIRVGDEVIYKRPIAGPDIVAVAKESADVKVIAFGTDVACGIDGDAIFRAVMASNMTKPGGPVRADGKQLKGPNYRPADIEGALRAQGWSDE